MDSFRFTIGKYHINTMQIIISSKKFCACIRLFLIGNLVILQKENLFSIWLISGYLKKLTHKLRILHLEKKGERERNGFKVVKSCHQVTYA